MFEMYARMNLWSVELLGFLLPALLHSVTRSELVLYGTLMGYFAAHRAGLPAIYRGKLYARSSAHIVR